MATPVDGGVRLAPRDQERSTATRRWSGPVILHDPAEIVAPAAAVARTDTAVPDAVLFDHVSFAFDDLVVLRDVSFTIPVGSMRILLGASGSGKSVLLKLILGLFRPDSGAIYVKGQRIDTMPERDLVHVRADIGMLFQEGALFDSLTVADNVGYRLYEETDMPWDEVRSRVQEVWGSSASRSTSTGCPRSCPAGSGGAWRSPARWPRSRA